MAQSTDRGDYTVSFRSHKDGFVLTMTPKQMDTNIVRFMRKTMA